MKRKSAHVRLDLPTKDTLKNWKRELEVIEQQDVPMGEIVKRLTKGTDTLDRLKQGSVQRKGQR